MLVAIKQNWSNGLWWVKPADDDSRMVLRESHMDNGMRSNEWVAKNVGRDWLQHFLMGAIPANEWHTVSVTEV